MDSADQPMKFSLEELKKEYKDNNLYGLLCVNVDLPITLMKGYNLFDFRDLTEEKLKLLHDTVLEAVKTQPDVKSKLIHSYEEVIQNGLL